MNITTKDGSAYSPENFDQLKNALKTSTKTGKKLYLIRDESGSIQKTVDKSKAISLKSLESLKKAITEKRKVLDKLTDSDARSKLKKNYNLVQKAIAYQKSVLFNKKSSSDDIKYPFDGGSVAAPKISFTTDFDSITEETDSDEEIESLTQDLDPTQIEIFAFKPSIQKNPDQIKALKEMPLQARERLRFLILEQKKSDPSSEKYLELETKIDRTLKGVKMKSVQFEPDLEIIRFSKTFPEKLSKNFIEVVNHDLYEIKNGKKSLKKELLAEISPILLTDENLLESSNGPIKSIDSRLIESTVKSITYEIEDLFMGLLYETKKIIQDKIKNKALIDASAPQKYKEDVAFDILLKEFDKFVIKLNEKYPAEKYPLLNNTFMEAATTVSAVMVTNEFKLLIDEFMNDKTWS